MIIILDPRSNLPLWEQIVLQTKEQMLRNILVKGDKLPSVRELATTLVINPNTVSRAYQELERNGVIETIRGKGTFVIGLSKEAVSSDVLLKYKNKLSNLLIECLADGIREEEINNWVKEFYSKKGAD
ncbi:MULTISPECIES: GntR family transcriptional regulator [unclassified Bacillus (in: firmicutes)]|uniref:GntR family transcriptional regulator n=1 Tax=Bacillaceae TaxID=186817 RepID=UPI000BF20AC7|nr:MULTISPECIES: GntR family transcriptional regulator [unclassified Bacillus (in: firmicutes)]PEJ53697.1 GntR family transcriptional regulator [Bacillus sp. AFS002410]PEK98070.1 GntR family transcriptional regulator [Bacillus sp. AFS017336]QKE71745.1 GntR family transcriptional regulator [Arthrobacter citreus]